MTTLLISLSRPDTVYGTHPVQYAVLDGRRVVEGGDGVADELAKVAGGSLRVAMDSASNVTERVRLRALARRFVPVLVQRHLADGGFFTERFRARSHVVSLRQGEAEVDVVAMLEDDAELAQELLPTRERPLTHLVSAECAVAALVGAATSEPVLVHWWSDTGLRSLGVRAGRVLWQWVQPVQPGLTAHDEGIWRPLLDAATASAPTEFGGTHGNVIRLGPGPWAAGGEWASNGSRELIHRIAALLRDVDPADLLSAPQLFGLAFVENHQSLIVNGYRQRVQAWRWAPAVATVCSVAGAALMGLGWWWHHQATELTQAQYQDAYAMAAQAKLVAQQRPSAEAMTALRSAAWREKALGVNLRADRFLSELFSHVPAGAQVLQIKLVRDDAASDRVKLKNGQPERVARQRATPAPEPKLAASEPEGLQPAGVPLSFKPAAPTRRMPNPGDPSYQVDLKIALSGGYASAKLNAEALAEQLSRLGRLSDTRLIFEDQGPLAPGARLQTRLTIAAGAF
ncbi:hypothetical protein [Hydrogenophaga sp.]|uniref:hypothetical protein n=1 Tax=Hydrogenophaga sp. TaxID=1904254 RepID=UPI0035AD9854